MAIRKIPTTADIYLEVNGVRVAVVQSYKVTASRESKAIYAFGQSEPVSTIRGQSQYVLELTRLYATDEAIRDGLNFCDMDDFSLCCMQARSERDLYGLPVEESAGERRGRRQRAGKGHGGSRTPD